MAETETLSVAETNGRNRNTSKNKNSFQLQDCNQHFSYRIAASILGGLQFQNVGLKIPVIYLEDTHQPDCFTSQNKIIKIKLGSKGPGTKGKLDFHRQKT